MKTASNQSESKKSANTSIAIVCIIFLIAGGSLLLLKFLPNKTGTVEYLKGNITSLNSASWDSGAKEIIHALDFNESDVLKVYKSPADEYLIFVRDGILTNRYQSYSYIPFKNIDKITKELCRLGGAFGKAYDIDSYLVTIKTDVGKEGTKIVLGKGDTFEDLKNGFITDRGIVVLESVSKEKMIEVDKTFLDNGIKLEEQECQPL